MVVICCPLWETSGLIFSGITEEESLLNGSGSSIVSYSGGVSRGR